jgi:predicted metal-dependent hydrolase
MTTAKENCSIRFNGEPYSYTLIRRSSRRNINMRITYEGELVVSAPPGVSLKRIHTVLKRKERWIVGHLIKMRNAISTVDPLNSILLFGEPYTVIKKTAANRSSISVREEKKELILKYRGSTEEETRNQLKQRLQSLAKRELQKRISRVSDTLSISYTRLSVRDQKTRWGSSSGKGTISLNWRIIMAPEYVQDYLVVHELIHQLHRNHQRSFWNEVALRFPDYQEAERWLKTNSLLLAVLR